MGTLTESQRRLLGDWAIGGGQTGDEGKGKITDTSLSMILELLEELELVKRVAVTRLNGDNNAGHSLYVLRRDCPTAIADQVKLATHSFPSGVAYHNVDMFRARGMITDFAQLRFENLELNHKLGMQVEDRLYTDTRTPLNFIDSRVLDFARMMSDARHAGVEVKMGTTGRGIGPTYVTETERTAIHPYLFLDKNNGKDRLYQQLEARLERAAAAVQHVFGLDVDDFREILKEISGKEERAKGYLLANNLIDPSELDYTRFIDQSAFDDGKIEFDLDRVLEEAWDVGQHYKDRLLNVANELDSRRKRGDILVFEMAQGSNLDKRWGVPKPAHGYLGAGGSITSSHTIFPEIPLSTGVPLESIDNRLLVFKAYATKVGDHHSVTQIQYGDSTVTLPDGESTDLVDHLSKVEFGATTGRQRGVLWYDLVDARTYVHLNDPTDIAIVKLDMFSGADTLKVCTHYVDPMTGDEYHTLPDDPDIVGRCEPQYKDDFMGWTEDISSCRTFDELPEGAKEFVGYIIDELKKVKPDLELAYISNNPGRGMIDVRKVA